MTEIKINLLYPVPKESPITLGFGENPAAYYAYWLSGHNGIDFGVPVGTPVAAVASGTILAADYDSTGYGYYVKIDHGKYQTLYAHLDKFHYKKGQYIMAGCTLGDSGNTGNSTGPHLHFELRIPGHGVAGFKDAVDPMPYLKGEITSIVFQPEQSEGSIPPTSYDPPATPIYLATVNINKLYVRITPDISKTPAGSLPHGITVAVYKLIEKDGNTWAQLGNSLFIASFYKGSEYLLLQELS